MKSIVHQRSLSRNENCEDNDDDNVHDEAYMISMCLHGCILPGLGTYYFSPILLPTRKLGTIRHLENGGNQNFTEAFVTLIVTM